MFFHEADGTTTAQVLLMYVQLLVVFWGLAIYLFKKSSKGG